MDQDACRRASGRFAIRVVMSNRRQGTCAGISKHSEEPPTGCESQCSLRSWVGHEPWSGTRGCHDFHEEQVAIGMPIKRR